MKYWLRLSLGVLIFLLVALAGYISIEQSIKSDEAFLRGDPDNVENLVPVNRQSSLTIRHIGLGMSEREVISILGKPQDWQVNDDGTLCLVYDEPLAKLHFEAYRGVGLRFRLMDVDMKDGRVDSIWGAVLEINGHEELRRGDRPCMKPRVFSLLGPEDWGNPGIENGEKDMLQFTSRSNAYVRVYSMIAPMPREGFSLSNPFLVDCIVLSHIRLPTSP